MYTTHAWATSSPACVFEKIQIKRNVCGDNDITFAIKFCGICHSDVHIADNSLAALGRPTNYPCVPGHELAGVVTEVGKDVSGYRVGDHVGVGCISDSCLTCASCQEGGEHGCHTGMTGTYNGAIKHGHIKTDKSWTFGGYSGSMTVNKRFIVKIPTGFPLEAAGPVFCAGITMYSPLSYHNAKGGGLRVGIVGIGGLGQMGIRLAKAMGNKVTAISTSPNKEAAAKAIGADTFVVSKDPASMKAAAMSCNLILNTVSVDHELSTYLPLLANKGTLVMIGAVLKNHSVSQVPLMYRKLNITGSVIGGMPETQECIDFCHKHKIVPQIKIVKASDISDVYKVLVSKNDSIIRHVLDIEASS